MRYSIFWTIKRLVSNVLQLIVMYSEGSLKQYFQSNMIYRAFHLILEKGIKTNKKNE